MWLVIESMTKQKWEVAVVDQKTTVEGRYGEIPDVNKNQDQEYHISHLQWKCTQSTGLNEAYSSLAEWCAFYQVAETLT